MRYSLQDRDRIFVHGFRFLPFAKDMGTNIGKNISTSFIGKYSQKLFDYAKQSATDAIKYSSKKSHSKNRRSNW